MVISIEALENDAIRHDLVDVVYIHSKSTASALIVVRLACLLFRPPISPTTSATEGFLLFMADLVLKFKTNPKIDLLPIKQVLIKESDYIKSTLCSDLVRSNGQLIWNLLSWSRSRTHNRSSIRVFYSSHIESSIESRQNPSIRIRSILHLSNTALVDG